MSEDVPSHELPTLVMRVFDDGVRVVRGLTLSAPYTSVNERSVRGERR